MSLRGQAAKLPHPFQPWPPVRPTPRRPNLQLSDLQSLRVFAAVARAGGMSAAQADLGMSLSNISAQISGFEQRFRLRLCERGRAGFALTPEGERILSMASEVDGYLGRFADELAELGGSLRGSLCVAGHGGDYTHAEYVLPQAIGRLMRRPNNQANVRLEIGSQSFILNGIVNGGIDVGIGHFAVATDGVVKRPIYRERASLYCGRAHPLFARSPGDITPEDIAACDFAMRNETATLPEALGQPRVRAIAPTQEARALLVISGAFLAFLPDHVAHRWVARDEMRAIGGPGMGYETEMQIVTRDHKLSGPLLRAFLEDYAAEALLARAGALAGSAR